MPTQSSKRGASFVKDLEYKINMSVVASKISAREKPEVSQKEFSRGIGMPVSFALPWDPKAITVAAKAGRAITDAAPINSTSFARLENEYLKFFAGQRWKSNSARNSALKFAQQATR